MATRHKTGEKCPHTGKYGWDGYTDGTRSPTPTADAARIPLETGETFPPCMDKGAYWVWDGVN